jgi:Acetyltransferase (GNAT) family.
MLENFTVIDAFTEKHVNNLLELYRNETWTKDRTAADVKAMLNNCHFIALVNKNNDEIIAFARFLSDSVYRAFVYDVIVSMKYRGLGYGRIILDHLINSPLLKK